MQRTEIVDIVQRAGQAITEQYVFPDVGEQLSKLLTQQLASGRYDQVSSPETLGALVTEDLQSINGDLHLRLKHHEIEIPETADDPMEGEITRLAETTMGGVARVQHHPGNIGHLELGPYLLPPTVAGAAVTAALQLVAPTRALLLDLRGTLGGSPEMVALICGYLFDEPIHLISFYGRSDKEARQSWTPPYVPGPRFGGHKPLYVLTSGSTFSAGEELTYDLQQHNRATVVGERTRGGAHPRIGLRLHPHLELTLPVGRPLHPVTGTNWEGTGVTPDIEVPADEAFDTAYQAALTTLNQ
ncbi:MAG TPA: S41 family peptidase [Micromonosporaceae bacterium]|nr:S41 family peptidase [Micromonosporaceae bacterium]